MSKLGIPNHLGIKQKIQCNVVPYIEQSSNTLVKDTLNMHLFGMIHISLRPHSQELVGNLVK